MWASSAARGTCAAHAGLVPRRWGARFAGRARPAPARGRKGAAIEGMMLLAAAAAAARAQGGGTAGAQLALLRRAARAKGFPFSARREAFQELLPAFGARWAEQNRDLGRSPAAQGAVLIASLRCTAWSCSRGERGAGALEARVEAAHGARRPTTALVLRFRVEQRADLFTFAVCTATRGGGAPSDWAPLVGFEASSPRDGSGYKKVRTDSENLKRLCAAHAPALSSIDLAEMLASVPVLPAAWIDCVRAHVLEDAAADAAWEEGSSEAQLESASSLDPDSVHDSQAGGD